MSSDRSLVLRTDLAPQPSGTGGRIASLWHLSDLHVLDAASPMRFEWIETLAHDPRWRPLLHMHRPQESLVPWALAAHVVAMRQDEPVDLVLSTGDNIDNAQRNELDAYLALMAGGVSRLTPLGGPQDARSLQAGEAWPYWSPVGAVIDTWKPRGFPIVDDLLERASEPLHSPGVGMPWSSLPGNHDLLCQGTAFVNDALTAIAVGGRKALGAPGDFEPEDVLSLFVDAPDQFIGVGDRTVAADPLRRGIDLAEWIDVHAAAGALGWFEGRSPTGRADAVVELGEVTLVLLDTNHPLGDYQGSIGAAQVAWLDEVLTGVDAAGGLAVIASHHGPDSLVNERGHDPDRLLAAPLLAVVHRHPSVVLWLSGHRHIHRITPRPGASGGFWEITTASIIDWPSERRRVDIARHTDGTVEIAATVHAHGAPEGSLAAWHAQLAQRFGGSQVRHAMAGTDADRDVRLFVHR
jgi:metallophosphoesterase (TIGR03767 family)